MMKILVENFSTRIFNKNKGMIQREKYALQIKKTVQSASRLLFGQFKLISLFHLKHSI